MTEEKVSPAKSQWLNPIVIGVFVAALGLIGNVYVTAINNDNTQKLERLRTRSTLILQAINTNGDTNAACKNLIFFVSLGLLEDTNHTITGACPGNVQGVPSISVVDGPADAWGGHVWYPLRVQTVDGNGVPLSGVSVEANLVSPVQIPPEWSAEWSKKVWFDKNYSWILDHTSSHCMSDKDGNCYLGMAPSGEFVVILAKKNGYVGNRTNAQFTKTSIVVVLQKAAH